MSIPKEHEAYWRDKYHDTPMGQRAKAIKELQAENERLKQACQALEMAEAEALALAANYEGAVERLTSEKESALRVASQIMAEREEAHQLNKKLRDCLYAVLNSCGPRGWYDAQAFSEAKQAAELLLEQNNMDAVTDAQIKAERESTT